MSYSVEIMIVNNMNDIVFKVFFETMIFLQQSFVEAVLKIFVCDSQ